MDIGTLALVGAIILFAWGLISLGRDKSKSHRKRRDDDDDHWDDRMLGAC